MSTYTKFTGMKIGVAFNALTILGIDEAEVAEDGAGLPKLLDTTTAPATVYENTADPLGSATPPKTQARVSGLASNADYDTGGWLTLLGTTYELVVLPQHTAGASGFTLTNAYLASIDTIIEVGAYTRRVYTFEAEESGAWAAHS
jgi:hypothetical protein